MTNREYREAYRLTEREKAQMWQEIRHPARQSRRPAPRWLAWSGGLAAAAACALAIAMFTTGEDGRVASETTDFAVRSFDTPVATPRPEIDPQMAVKAPGTLDEAAIVPPPATAEEPFIREAEVSSRAGSPARAAATRMQADTAGLIRGLVRDAESGAPLASATVVLMDPRRQTITDQQGRFRFGGLAAGEYTVQVRYLGYATGQLVLAVAGADTTEAEYALAPEIVATEIVESVPAFDVDASRSQVETRNATSPSPQKFERYAIESVEDALSREAGKKIQTGESYVPGGRSGPVEVLGDAPAGAESGGTRNPNDRPYDLVYHQHHGVNPFVVTEEDALSTFAIEVDDASWGIARRYLTDGHLPPPEAVRLEEIVNHLDAQLEPAGSDDFSLHVAGLPSRFGPGYHLVRVGVRARDVDAAGRHPAHLVFVIDVSGSMNRENRLGLVKQSLRVLVDELREGDRVGIVTYGSEARVVLEPTGVENREQILTAIDGLHTGGSTNAEAGLRLAYEMARREQRPHTISRLILCSDGVANVGRTGPDSILAAIRSRADEGIALTTVGFGMGNYNDVLMEQLADQGDGTYHYVQRLGDAERVFRENLTGTLEAMGREVKVQVEFDPERVVRWRLLGYENRDVADEDFRNDQVDAGDIGAGHTAVALYEVKLTDDTSRDIGQGWSVPLGTVRLRWARPPHHPQAGVVTEIQRGLMSADLSPSWDTAPAPVRLAAVAAEFAEILRKSYWARDSSLDDLASIARELAGTMDDPMADELAEMITRAASISDPDH